ncbi:hypothetical protein EBT25_19290 [bacterium]|jgi:hypothetical protein|nr:hypothetical protein [bacterium]
MRCRACSSKNTRVTCTDHFSKDTRRYCRCLDCGERFVTIEKYAIPKPGPQKGVPRRGVIAKGSDHGSSFLTDENILEIRKMHAEGKTYKKISEKFGISPSYISRIVTKKLWKHLP